MIASLVLAASLAGPLPLLSGFDLTGSWNLVIRPAEPNTCPFGGRNSALQWVVSQNDDELTIRQTGGASPVTLRGTNDGKGNWTIVTYWTGLRQGLLAPHVSEGGEVVLYLHQISTKLLRGMSWFLGRDGLHPCMTSFLAEASRQ